MDCGCLLAYLPQGIVLAPGNTTELTQLIFREFDYLLVQDLAKLTCWKWVNREEEEEEAQSLCISLPVTNEHMYYDPARHKQLNRNAEQFTCNEDEYPEVPPG